MPKKTHHVVPNPEGGWDIKKGVGIVLLVILITNKMQLIKEGR